MTSSSRIISFCSCAADRRRAGVRRRRRETRRWRKRQSTRRRGRDRKRRRRERERNRRPSWMMRKIMRMTMWIMVGC